MEMKDTKDFNIDEEILDEVSPPDKDIETWIQHRKPEFKKRYGDDYGAYLYGRAWKMYNKKKGL